MRPPEEYLQQLEDMGLTNATFRADSITEARAVITRVRQMEQELRQIKRDINLDVKQIRHTYADKAANAGQGTAGLFTLFGKRKMAGSIRADAKRSVNRERDAMIAAYERVKLTVDDLLNQTAGVKAEMEAFIAEQKAEAAQATPRKGGFCPQCGAKVRKSDKYCAECGTQLG